MVFIAFDYFRTTVSVDDDECLLSNGGCDQICYNTEASHKCGCRPGFSLAPDGKKCLGAKLLQLPFVTINTHGAPMTVIASTFLRKD